jgi:hypothetical protein
MLLFSGGDLQFDADQRDESGSQQQQFEREAPAKEAQGAADVQIRSIHPPLPDTERPITSRRRS